MKCKENILQVGKRSLNFWSEKVEKNEIKSFSCTKLEIFQRWMFTIEPIKFTYTIIRFSN